MYFFKNSYNRELLILSIVAVSIHEFLFTFPKLERYYRKNPNKLMNFLLTTIVLIISFFLTSNLFIHIGKALFQKWKFLDNDNTLHNNNITEKSTFISKTKKESVKPKQQEKKENVKPKKESVKPKQESVKPKQQEKKESVKPKQESVKPKQQEKKENVSEIFQIKIRDKNTEKKVRSIIWADPIEEYAAISIASSNDLIEEYEIYSGSDDIQNFSGSSNDLIEEYEIYSGSDDIQNFSGSSDKYVYDYFNQYYSYCQCEMCANDRSNFLNQYYSNDNTYYQYCQCEMCVNDRSNFLNQYYSNDNTYYHCQCEMCVNDRSNFLNQSALEDNQKKKKTTKYHNNPYSFSQTKIYY